MRGVWSLCCSDLESWSYGLQVDRRPMSKPFSDECSFVRLVQNHHGLYIAGMNEFANCAIFRLFKPFDSDASGHHPNDSAKCMLFLCVCRTMKSGAKRRRNKSIGAAFLA